jgi:hypothetical protein
VQQFDVVENPDPETRRYSPFLVVLQSHHLDPIETIFLAPLISDAQRPVSPVDIPIEFNGEPLVMAIGEAAGVPRAGFGRVRGSVAEQEDAIRRAFERLLGGF